MTGMTHDAMLAMWPSATVSTNTIFHKHKH